MDKKTTMEKLACELNKKDGFNGAWLYAEKGEIVSKGVPDYFDDADWFIRIWKEEKRVPGNDEILRFLRETKAKPYFAPEEGLHGKHFFVAEKWDRLSKTAEPESSASFGWGILRRDTRSQFRKHHRRQRDRKD